MCVCACVRCDFTERVYRSAVVYCVYLLLLICACESQLLCSDRYSIAGSGSPRMRCDELHYVTERQRGKESCWRIMRQKLTASKRVVNIL